MTKKNKKYKSLKACLKDLQSKKTIFWYISAYYLRFIDFLRMAPKEIKWFFQRANRGWADCDTWSFGSYIAKIISEGTEHLAEHVYGYPCSSPNDKMTLGKWIDILWNISNTFDWEERICDGTAYYIPSNRPESEYKQMKKDFEEVHKRCKAYPGRIMTRAEAKEYEKGWKLFRQYFTNLWD